MQVGVTFPQIEISADPVAVRDYAQAAEDMGFTHLLAFDHVIGADISNRPNWTGSYTHRSLFHEPFVLFGYLAGVTNRIELVTNILILPQRQTVLVAKQAAEVDVLTGGRFRLGVGVGWNPVEYQALNEDFSNRGKRSEEQIEVLRALFTQESVTFDGRWHHIEAAGINPLPVQRPIPIWLGGMSDVTLDRVARLGDGWFPQGMPDDANAERIHMLHDLARRNGRELSSIGIEARISIGQGTADDWRRDLARWGELGATRVGINTMGAGLRSPQEHIDALRRFKEDVLSA